MARSARRQSGPGHDRARVAPTGRPDRMRRRRRAGFLGASPRTPWPTLRVGDERPSASRSIPGSAPTRPTSPIRSEPKAIGSKHSWSLSRTGRSSNAIPTRLRQEPGSARPARPAAVAAGGSICCSCIGSIACRNLGELIARRRAAGLRRRFSERHQIVRHGNPAGRMLVQLLGSFAEFERTTMLDRIRAGMERKGGPRRMDRWPAAVWISQGARRVAPAPRPGDRAGRAFDLHPLRADSRRCARDRRLARCAGHPDPFGRPVGDSGSWSCCGTGPISAR